MFLSCLLAHSHQHVSFPCLVSSFNVLSSFLPPIIAMFLKIWKYLSFLEFPHIYSPPFLLISPSNQAFIATTPLFTVTNNVYLPKLNDQFLDFLFLFPVGFYYQCILIYFLICFRGPTVCWTFSHFTGFSLSLSVFLCWFLLLFRNLKCWNALGLDPVASSTSLFPMSHCYSFLLLHFC